MIGKLVLKKRMNDIKKFINEATILIKKIFSEQSNNNYDLSEVYPYLYNVSASEKNCNIDYSDFSCDYIGKLYESIMPSDVKKNFGQFYTRDSSVIDTMLENIDLLQGKILEPSCGSGVFVIKIIEKIIFSLKKKNHNAEYILNYICDNIYANDCDINAVKITELNVLAHLIPLILEAKRNNPLFIMKKLNLMNLDFIRKNQINGKFSIVIGNPPFVTLYGKRSCNMTEKKRLYYNKTFNFVQNKNKNNKFNTSMFFIENGLELLKTNGTLSYILDISFFETAFKDLRKYIVQNYYIQSLITGLSAFCNVSSGQIILTIKNIKQINDNLELIDYKTKEKCKINQSLWNNNDNEYKFTKPLNSIEEKIKNKMEQFSRLIDIFPGKSLRTCCALTGRTEDFIVKNNKELNDDTVFPYIEGSKGIRQKFGTPQINRYIKYDYDLQIKISNEFKKELEKKGVKNKKRVTLGDKEAYLSHKIFIRQSAKEIIATFSNKPYAANNSIYILTCKKNDEINTNMLKYTCGLLNSNLITFYSRMCQIIRMNYGKTPQIKISDLKKLPLAFNEKYFFKLIKFVDLLLSNPDDNFTYQKLNQLVYKIYNISSDEISYIENYLK